MAYRPTLTVDVEALGAVFVFGAADKATQQFQGTVAALNAGGTASVVDTDGMPETLVAAFASYFVDGVKSWRDVEGADGEPLPCTLANRAAIPTDDKVTVVSAYLRALAGIGSKKEPPSAPPTTSTPPASDNSENEAATVGE